jgi:hypothetical protein
LNGHEELAERPAHDPRDLHLGDPEQVADLVLVQVPLEAKLQDAALALLERGVLGGELGLHRVVAGLDPAHRLDHWRGFLSASGHVERQGATRLLGLQGL